MAIIYLEELTKHVENKYLAVNVIAKRARAINDDLMGAGLTKKQKPVSVATEELAAGELTYQKIDPTAVDSDTKLVFTTESDDYDEVDTDEHIAEIFGESITEDNDTNEEPAIFSESIAEDNDTDEAPDESDADQVIEDET